MDHQQLRELLAKKSMERQMKRDDVMTPDTAPGADGNAGAVATSPVQSQPVTNTQQQPLPPSPLRAPPLRWPDGQQFPPRPPGFPQYAPDGTPLPGFPPPGMQHPRGAPPPAWAARFRSVY